MISKFFLTLWVLAPFIWLVDSSCYPKSADETSLWLHEDNDSNELNSTKQLHPRNMFSPKLESDINRQINLELFAHYTYLSMASHFDRYDRNLPGFQKFFAKMAEEEHEHAQKFIKYQNKRGGRVLLKSIKEPCKVKWGNGLAAMREALLMEQYINKMLIELHQRSTTDPQFLDWLESNFLGEQVDSIKQLSDYVSTLERINTDLGEYHFDKLTLRNEL